MLANSLGPLGRSYSAEGGREGRKLGTGSGKGPSSSLKNPAAVKRPFSYISLKIKN